ncbi:MAG: acetyl-CoA carboxylase biotin carboxylase subunit, partial [Pyrinomonadaceae bacterium]
RLQVEHPITEMVVGVDLVHLQLRIAQGQPLPFTQGDLAQRGHAIECRVYAEDPDNNFFPSPGRITHLRVPSGPGIRDDSGVSADSEVSIHYDSLISKLAAWGRTRHEAIGRLRRALDEYLIVGIKTTLPFFRKIVDDKEFLEGRLDTSFISRFDERRQSSGAALNEEEVQQRDLAVLAAAVHYTNLRRQAATSYAAVVEAENRWKMSGRAAPTGGKESTDGRNRKTSR